MKYDEITILSCKIGKTVVMGYHHKQEDKNYSVENDETPHPDLLKQLKEFNEELAYSFYVEDKTSERFIPNGFVVHEKEGVFSLEIKGKLNTQYDQIVNVSSGKIPYSEGGEIVDEDVADKLTGMRLELFAYMFDGKNAQQKIPFKD